MDWLDPTNEERVVIAVIRYPAKSRENYLGPVFVNPGGPGGSGVEFLRGKAEELQTIVGDNHDIISFDPRGVGASIPRIDCWSSALKRTLWASSQIAVIDSHPGVIFDAYASARAWSSACESTMTSSTSMAPNLLRHIATASHARDMLAILDGTGFPRLRYWGFSYGTILGGTFAAMFPDRVERLVSDGNVDYGDWYKAEQLNFLRDANKIMDAFGIYCHKAGPERCAFWAESPEAVEARLDKLLATLRTHPVLIPASEHGPEMPELVTYANLRRLISFSFYKPFQKFPTLARVFASLEKGDGRPYLEMVTAFGPEPGPIAFCSLNETSPLVPEDVAYPEAFPAIMCADGEQVTDGPEEIARYAEQVVRMSRATGAANTHFRTYCVGREVRPKWRFAGESVLVAGVLWRNIWADKWATGPFNGTVTSHPLLFIGNIGDNVTPLLSAHNNSANFEGSIVLTQKSYGVSAVFISQTSKPCF
jgi:pimeloyl-ACP methyl ester carboxylesterase